MRKSLRHYPRRCAVSRCRKIPPQRRSGLLQCEERRRLHGDSPKRNVGLWALRKGILSAGTSSYRSRPRCGGQSSRLTPGVAGKGSAPSRAVMNIEVVFPYPHPRRVLGCSTPRGPQSCMSGHVRSVPVARIEMPALLTPGPHSRGERSRVVSESDS
jgi:hypothetical protein